VKSFGLVLLTSDDDVARKSTPGAAVFGAAAADVEEGFDIAASEGTSSLLQVRQLLNYLFVKHLSLHPVSFTSAWTCTTVSPKLPS
jgi:hypothetical protein